jgi:hypothetical protein
MNSPEEILGFARCDVVAEEPQDLNRNWSLIEQINPKQIRP